MLFIQGTNPKLIFKDEIIKRLCRPSWCCSVVKYQPRNQEVGDVQEAADG